MWGFVVSKVTPFLLAMASTTTEPSSLQSGASIIGSNPATWSPQTPSDLSRGLRQVYEDLEVAGPHSKYMTPSTLRFTYVSPPTANGTSTWRKHQDGPDDPDKPIAVFLPGLDGYGISACRNQFDDMASAFELWRLTVLPEDMSSFSQVVQAVVDFVEEMEGREVLLVGESCGGLIASAAAIRLEKSEALDGLVLVNPATSFDQTLWDTLVPVLTSLQYLDNRENKEESASPYGVLGSLILSSLIPDSEQQQRIFDLILSLPSLSSPNPSQLPQVFEAMGDAFRGTEERLPPAMLEHRVLKWLVPGASVVNSRLDQISIPTLVIAGKEDRLMPSEKEAERLVDILPNAESLVVPKRGHFVLDDSVNLTEAILYSKIDPLHWGDTKKAFDPITDWKKPPSAQIEKELEGSVKNLRDLFSPVFFSTDQNNKRWKGLSKIPRPDGPLLFVANHQFLGLDLSLILSEFLEEKGELPRGLAHPVAFAGSSQIDGFLGRKPGILGEDNGFGPGGSFQKFGAVLVTPRNYYRLMQTGQDGLLFPGGAKETQVGDKSYPLFWPEKVDFVRTAARFNATIVPLSAIGMVDSFNVLAEVEQVWDLPLIGNFARNFSASTTAARFDQQNEDEVFGFPLLTPGVPARNYFLFGKPIDTAGLDPKDKESCERVYKQAKQGVRTGLDDLLRARDSDPYKSTPKRLAYEQVFRKTAPTFSVEELNKRA